MDSLPLSHWGNPQFITLDPKHRSLRKCYSLSQIKNTVGHCPAPTISLPHTHQKEDSQLLDLLSWLCDSAQSPLWFCSPSPGRTAEIYLSVIEKADVISRSWHYLGKKQVVPCVSVFQKDWRMVRSRLAYLGETGLSFLAGTFRLRFYDGENFHVSDSIPASYSCSILTKGSSAFLTWCWCTIQRDEIASRYNFRNLSGVTWHRGFPSVFLVHWKWKANMLVIWSDQTVGFSHSV